MGRSPNLNTIRRSQEALIDMTLPSLSFPPARMPCVPSQVIDVRPDGHHSAGIQPSLHRIVVLLYLREIHRLGYAMRLVHISEPSPQVRVVPQMTNVALEVAIVDNVEANGRSKQAYVSKLPGA